MRVTRFSIGSLLAVIAIVGVAMAALRNPSYLWANAAFTAALLAVVAAVVNAIVGKGARRAYWLGFALFGGVYLAVCSIPALRDSVCPHLVTEAIFDMVYPYTAPASPQPPPAPPYMATVLNGATFTVTPTPGAPTPVAPRLPPLPPGRSPFEPDYPESSTPAPAPPQFPAPVAPNVAVGPAPSGGAVQPAQFAYYVQVQPTSPTSPWAAWTAPDRSIGVGYQIGSINLVSSEAFRQIAHSLMALPVATLGGVFAGHRYQVSARDGQVTGPASLRRDASGRRHE
jgi:hypothetical protein